MRRRRPDARHADHAHVDQLRGLARRGVNVSRLLGRDIGASERPQVFNAPKGQPVSILASADGLFEVIMESKGRSVLITGAARTDNGPGPQAACLIWGTAFRVG